MRKMRSAGNEITIEAYRWTDKPRRVATWNNFSAFCTTYLKHMFPIEDGPDQIESKANIEHVVKFGGLQGEAAPRGSGKTQRAEAGCMFAVLNGWWHFAAFIAATAQLGKQGLEDIVKELADNELLAEDYPEICLPIREAYGKPQRAKHITINGNPCRLECTAGRLVFPTSGLCEGAPKQYEGAVLMSAGITAALRGLRFKTPDGETMRPDGALIDDIQTRKSAKSSVTVAKILQIIRGDILRLGGPAKEISALAMVTVIEKKDAAEQMLDHKVCPEWRGIRKRMVNAWPKSAKWAEYQMLYKAGMLDNDTSKATEFYALHRAEMDEGAEVSWPQRKEGRLSAIQLAYDLIAKLGEEAFFAECQNQPIEQHQSIVKLHPEQVMQRVNGLAMGEVPPEAQIITGFIDPNDHALAWMMCGWWNRGGLTGSVIGYGEWGRNGNGPIGNVNRADKIWDESKPAPEGKEQAFWRALTELEGWLFEKRWIRNGQPVMPTLVLTDVGYTLKKGDDTIYRWLGQMAKSGHGGLGYSRGFPANRFRAEKKAEGDRFDTLDYSPSEWWRFDKFKIVENVFGMPHDADYHRREVQQALMLDVGSPGSIVLNGKSGTEHVTLSQQVASEHLVEYKASDQTGISGFYQFNTVPGIRQEMADCLRGCRLGALFKLRNALGAVVAEIGHQRPPEPPPASGGAVVKIKPPAVDPAGNGSAFKRPVPQQASQRHAIIQMTNW